MINTARILGSLLVSCLGVCFLLPAFSSVVAQAPDSILYNGNVFTSDPSRAKAEAIAITGDRIQAVGTSPEIRKLGTEKTRLIDLQGRTVVPGFNDAHAHFGPTVQGIDLELKTLEPDWTEVTAAIKTAAVTAPKGKWLFGVIGERVINDASADRAALDRIAPDNPIFLFTYFGHGAIINSPAMKALKISENEADPLGGRLERDYRTKKFTGRIFEYAGWRYHRMLVEEASDQQLVEELRKRMNEATALGITSMQIMPAMSTERFVRLLQAADVPIRVRVIAFSNTTSKSRDLTDIRALAKLKLSHPNVTPAGIKWILDGTPLERGAAMRLPYVDQPNSKGIMNFSRTEMEKMVQESLQLNQQLIVHAVGDRAVEGILNAMDNVGAGKIDWPSKRVRIEHGEGVAGDLIDRAKRLGVIVVQNPSHFTVVSETNARWGKDSKFSRQQSLIAAGIRYALGSDGPINPFLNIMFAAVDPMHPSEAITREEAVRAYTAGSAFAEFAETKKGTIARGMLADLAVLSQDIFSLPLDALPGTTSIMTIVGGKIVHDAKVLK